MKKPAIITCFVFFCLQFLKAQDAVQYRLILIGDAGETNAAQQSILAHAIAKNIPGKTSALFLGDNVYPKGVELDAVKKEVSLNILRSQFEGLRKNGIPVYFIPGNHDWDKSGPDGYEKIIAANQFFESIGDSLLQLIPADACPGPYELHVSGNVVVVAMDSEWWLYPFNKQTEKSDCVCKTKRDVLGRLTDIVQRNKNKTLIFATHHPFDTYGSHGGYYSFKEHFFPLTSLSKNLYIPLPVIGSLYPLLRKGFPPAEDLGNVLYRDMKKTVDDILKTHPNVIHVAGHEHTLQLIQGEVLQVVSGAGCKHTPVKKGKGSLFAAAQSGYVIADILADNSIKLSYYTYDDKNIRESFVYNKPFTAPALAGAQSTATITADSIAVRLNPQFDKVSGLHRSLFGENYRNIWAAETTIPVLHLSKTNFTPTELGGGMQTHSLRMIDENKKEWVIRSVDKFPDALVPQALNQTLATDILKDNVSAIFPYAPLSVPVFAKAAGIAHSNPTIMYVAPDDKLGIYSRDFANTVVLLEEREPLGKSYSTLKMQAALQADNDNSIDQYAFLTARMQDFFLGDWDRHGDQWRWVDELKGKDKRFLPVPRDRDQVFYINQGLFPSILALPWLMPKFQGFDSRIKNINTLAFNARLIDGLFTNELSYDDWMKAVQHIVASFTDTVIDAALKKMPANIYAASHTSLQQQLTKRRDDLLRAAPVYYKFLNKVIDITTSDKNEQVIIRDTLNGKLSLAIYKINKQKELGKLLYSRIIEPSITKEVNLYINGGEDNVSISNNAAPVKIRIIGDSAAKKHYDFSGAPKYLRKIHVYEGVGNASFTGKTGYVHKHLSAEPANTAMVLTDRYNKTIPLLTIGYNADDGFLMGAGVKWIRQGFRKQPYASTQQFVLGHSFSTTATNFRYAGEWLQLFGKTDLLLNAGVLAPDNTQNFYGLGNQTAFIKTGNFVKYHRARFNIINASMAFRWRKANNSVSVGPVYQFYHLDKEENEGRFITNTHLLHSYDSATIYNDKSHAGLVVSFNRDKRNNTMLPSFGSTVSVKLAGYKGLNGSSSNYAQLGVQLSGYKSIDRRSNVVIADRIGAGVSVGKPAFYQSYFLGSQENLYGYRQFRFGGEHMLYNNFEIRIKMANLASYVLPGQLGLVGFYDVGKVWQKGYNDNQWHQGAGGGLYFAPAQMMVFQLVVGGSKEGWYPYFSAGFRF
ncbi:MAG: BamA/TamA family outer membrane protein [Ferruginibacter sp.]